VWRGGAHGEDALLVSCYRNSLMLADQHGITSIAFPAISCGVYCFPLERATRIAIQEVRHHLDGKTGILKAVFACFGSETCEYYRTTLAAVE